MTSHLLLVTLLVALFHSGLSIYCGDESCYDVLGVKESANITEVRKRYRALSLESHPDKGGNPELFQRIARAYEVLSDTKLRAAYDHALLHPEDVFYNRYQFYNAKYQKYWKTDARIVLAATVLVISALQYSSQYLSYHQVMRHIRSTTKYRNSLARICEEQGHRSPGRAQGKKNQRRSEPAISAADMARRASILSHIICFVTFREQADAEVVLHGGHKKPDFRSLLLFGLLVLPIRLVQGLMWASHYLLRYKIQGRPYSQEDRDYFTRRALGASVSRWQALPEERRAELAAKELWVTANYNSWKAHVGRKGGG